MSKQYEKILIAVDLNSDDDNYILEKAKAITNNPSKHVYLVHAVEYLDPYGTGSAFHNLADIESNIKLEHKKAILEFGLKNNIDRKHVYVITGSSNQVLSELALELQADLVIVGYHVRHGLSTLFGSTASFLLHHSDCDLLVVKLPD